MIIIIVKEYIGKFIVDTVIYNVRSLHILLRKIKKHLKTIVKLFKNDCHFSIKLAIYGVMGNILGRVKPSIAQKAEKYRRKFVSNYLNYLLQGIINTNREKQNNGVCAHNAPIWVCWWTGIESAPSLVKQCVRSIQKAAGEHPVYIITKEYFQEYLEIPTFILEKVQNGNMCLANFSDYLRISLLEKYGGLWLDATIYVPRELPESIFENSLYTCKSPGAKGYLANGRWTSYCLGGWKNHLFFKMAKECFECYWRSEEVSIDYLLVDYIFDIIYNNNYFVKTCFDCIPINNMQRNDLAGAMVKGECAKRFPEIITDETIVYKLSWRENYPLEAKDGEESVYSYFLKMNL